jgi:hypothetical protein
VVHEISADEAMALLTTAGFVASLTRWRIKAMAYWFMLVLRCLNACILSRSGQGSPATIVVMPMVISSIFSEAYAKHASTGSVWLVALLSRSSAMGSMVGKAASRGSLGL